MSAKSNHDDQAILDLLENPDYTMSGVWFNLSLRKKKKLAIVYFSPNEIMRQDFIPSAELEQVLRTKPAYKEANSKYFSANFLHAQVLGQVRLRKLKLLISQ